MKNKTERRTGIEVLRILAMAAVVILHYNNTMQGGGMGVLCTMWIKVLLMNTFSVLCRLFASSRLICSF